ncbi:hypothetical protein [Desulfosporosinus orientis]|uniref:hypothetical protein n=1 Tax=Desulfosporosinus orientis TaxID=1563 RepID=UPI0002E83A90|nr:hypothetical protein [Desulfosporosinus orientis]
MRAWEIISEIARTILIMSATGGIIALLLFAIKPLCIGLIPSPTLCAVKLIVPVNCPATKR